MKRILFTFIGLLLAVALQAQNFGEPPFSTVPSNNKFTGGPYEWEITRVEFTLTDGEETTITLCNICELSNHYK